MWTLPWATWKMSLKAFGPGSQGYATGNVLKQVKSHNCHSRPEAHRLFKKQCRLHCHLWAYLWAGHHIGHEPWAGGGVRSRQMKPHGSSWSMRALLLKVVSSHRIKYDARLSGELTNSHGGPAVITVTKPEPIQTDKCYESQLLEETNPHRGKTSPPLIPVLEVGRALADSEGTHTSGTEQVTDSCLQVQTHRSPSKLNPLVKPLGSSLSGVPLTPIHVVQ